MINSTNNLKTVRGSMEVDRPNKRRYISWLKAKISFHRPLISAIGTVAFMALTLLLSVKSDYLFFKELTQAFSLVGMVLFVKALSQPLPQEDTSNPSAPRID